MVLGRQGIYLLISNRGRHSESGGNTGKGAPVNPNGGANLGCEAHRQHGWYEQISKFKSASSGAVILAGTCGSVYSANDGRHLLCVSELSNSKKLNVSNSFNPASMSICSAALVES